MIRLIKQYCQDVAHLFYPHQCAGCGSDLVHDHQFLCASCLVQLPETGFLACPDNLVEQVFYGRLPLAEAGSAFYFTKDSMLQQLLFRIKYQSAPSLAVYLGRLLGRQILASGRFNQLDGLVPVPLHPKRQRLRGYNQAELLAKGIGDVLQVPVCAGAIRRRFFTETQTHKNRVTRWQNIEGVFELFQAAELPGGHFLLVDDVVTTGATLEACGQCLASLPGTKLSLVTLAYSVA